MFRRVYGGVFGGGVVDRGGCKLCQSTGSLCCEIGELICICGRVRHRCHLRNRRVVSFLFRLKCSNKYLLHFATMYYQL